jgi:hypothetical protein
LRRRRQGHLKKKIPAASKIHNEEFSDPYSSANIVRVTKSRRIRLAGNVACMGEKMGVHRVLVEKPEGKRSLGRSRCR